MPYKKLPLEASEMLCFYVFSYNLKVCCLFCLSFERNIVASDAIRKPCRSVVMLRNSSFISVSSQTRVTNASRK